MKTKIVAMQSYIRLFIFIFTGLLLSHTAFSKVIRVPQDYSTIQMGINAAVNGDTVLVSDGTYYENIMIIGKEIVLASQFLIDGDTIHIYKTIINGSRPVNPDRASVLSVVSGKEMYLAPRVVGFTVTEGGGTLIQQTIETSEGTQQIDRYVGGGLYIEHMNPIFSYNRIVGNKIISTVTNNKRKKTSKGENAGGGSYSFFSRPNFGGAVSGSKYVNPGGNVFLDNFAALGKTFYAEVGENSDPILAENCYFDVYNYDNGSISEYWAFSNGGFSFLRGSGKEKAIVADVFVSADGNNSADGLTAQTAFRTLGHALSKVSPDSLHPIVIKLSPGIYSPSTNGEVFPIQAVSYTEIYGAGTEFTIIDVEGSDELPARGFVFENVEKALLYGVTITGGYNYIWNTAGGGGGVYCKSSDAILENVRIVNNKAGLEGGGLYLVGSTLKLENVEISRNEANKYGGGIFVGFGSSISLNHVTLSNNIAQFTDGGGGAIYANFYSKMDIKNSKIIGNTALNYGGGIYMLDSEINLVNSELSHNTAEKGGGIYNSNSTLNICNCTIANNSVKYEGGGLFLFRSQNVNIDNSKIIDNTSLKGGGLFAYTSAFSLEKVTISNNYATNGAGGLHLDFASKALITNSIIWGNPVNEIISTSQIFPNSITIVYSNIKDSLNGVQINPMDTLNWLDGNLNTDPEFDVNYAANPHSPLIDGGAAYYTYNNQILINIPKDKYMGVAPDIGAVEYINIGTGLSENNVSNGKLLLKAPYPNPFNDKVIFNLQLTENQSVKISIFDTSGKTVKSLDYGKMHTGSYNIVWNADDNFGNKVQEGVYFFRIESETFMQTGKIVYMK